MLGLWGIRITHVRRADLTGEFEHERLAVATCPFRHYVGHDSTIVICPELQRLAECMGHIDAVHPEVSQVDGVDEIPELPGLVHRAIDFHLGVIAYDRRRTAASSHRLRCDRRQPLDHLGGAEVGALADLN